VNREIYEQLGTAYLDLLRGDEPIEVEVEQAIAGQLADLWTSMGDAERAAIPAELDVRYVPREYR
jgi:hypothetical protein